MPIAKFEFPDGRIGRFDVPEGTTAEEAQAQIEAMVRESEQPSAPPPASPPVTAQAAGSGGENDAMKVLAEFAQSINVGIPQLLDMPSHVVNWMLEKAGTDVRIPATMEKNFNKLPSGEGGFMEPGMARDATRMAGQLTGAAMGMMPVQRAAGAVGSTIADVFGAGSTMATQPLKTGAMVLRDQVDNMPAILPGERSAREAAKLPLLRQSGDVQAAGYRLNDAGRVVPDAIQNDVIKQGFQPKLVAMVKSSTKLGRQKMNQMLDNVSAQQTNMLDDNVRPGNVAGESILTRAKIVQRANRAAGEKMKPVVDSLKGQSVDVNPAVMKMQETLDQMGVIFDPEKGTVNFTGSIIDDLPGPENAVKRLLTRMLSVNKVDAYEAHKLKRYIDEVVTYGKGGEGLSGEADRMLKRLRHDINTTLGESFPAYKKVNTQYHETIEALDGLQDIAGKRMDLSGPNADRALGVLSRRVFSNAVSGVPLDDAINHLDKVARKYVSPGGTDLVPYKAIQKSVGITPESLDDSLQAQIRFASELERHFKIAPSNSFQGVQEKAFDVMQSGLTGGSRGVLLDTAVNAMDRMRGINEDNAMKALRRLLAE